MAVHTTFKRSADGKAQTRNRQAMRALKYRQTDLSLTATTFPMGA